VNMVHITNFWSLVKEVDLGPIRQEALAGIKIAIIGAVGSGRAELADQMRRDPARSHLKVNTPLLILEMDNINPAIKADIIILMVDPANPDLSFEKNLARKIANKGRKVLVFLHQLDKPQDMMIISPEIEWGKNRVVCGSVNDNKFLLETFAPAIIALVPGKLLGLGRYFPLFRVPIAHYLINDNCISNAAYALSTGLAETVGIFNIPIAVADSIILTKNQAYLAYKLGLTLGYSTRWQDYIAEFGGVLGGGFVWRQIARTLVGIIPIWGIIPKTTIAYSGTYVVGNTILQWYLTGRHLSKKQIQGMYSKSLERGKKVARNILWRLPRPRLPKPKLPRISLRKQRALPIPAKNQICSECGKKSTIDAKFCQYCGIPFVKEPED